MSERSERSQKINKYYLKDGCVIRALESGFGVSASESEKAARILQQRVIDALYEGSLTPEDAAPFEKLKPFPKILEIRMVRALIEAFQHHNTPMGAALKAHIVEYPFLNGSELVRTALRRNRVVTAAYWTPSSGHMAHLVVAGGNLVQASDRHQRMPHFPTDKKHPSFVFTAKSR